MRRLYVLLTIIFSVSAPGYTEEAFNVAPFKVDARSAHMGAIGSLAEMVRLDVKKIGLGAPVTREEMETILPVVEQITGRNGVQHYRETDFLVTDLYPAGVTEGKEVVFIYTGNSLKEYLSLKEEKAHLVETGLYDKAARLRIATVFGKLLSYPQHTIKKLIADTNSAEAGH